jgi:hypothetical protein
MREGKTMVLSGAAESVKIIDWVRPAACVRRVSGHLSPAVVLTFDLYDTLAFIFRKLLIRWGWDHSCRSHGQLWLPFPSFEWRINPSDPVESFHVAVEL